MLLQAGKAPPIRLYAGKGDDNPIAGAGFKRKGQEKAEYQVLLDLVNQAESEMLGKQIQYPSTKFSCILKPSAIKVMQLINSALSS